MQRRFHRPIDNVLERLQGVRECNDSWIACCPAHSDTAPSLSVAVGSDGRVLLYCHAGCDVADVLCELKLTYPDLFPRLPAGNRKDVIREGKAGFIPPQHTVRQSYPDLSCVMHAYQNALTSAHLQALADQLGLPYGMLEVFQLGWWSDDTGQFWAIPEKHPAGRTIGIMRRYADGSKKTMAGSVRGLAIPNSLNLNSEFIFIPEGFSDTVVLTGCGYSAVGRPSAAGGTDLLCHLLRCFPGQIIILGENDLKPDGFWPGRVGAQGIATQLIAALGRTVRVLMPPSGFKDVRSLYTQAGPDAVTRWIWSLLT